MARQIIASLHICNIEQMTLLDSLKLTKFANKASYVQLRLFQNKGAALLNDLSPYVFFKYCGRPHQQMFGEEWATWSI